MSNVKSLMSKGGGLKSEGWGLMADVGRFNINFND